MANWYVRDSAAGTNAGTDWTNAWEDMNNINWTSVSRGDVIFVADGTYQGDILNKAVSGATYITVRKACKTGIGDGNHGTETGWIDTYGDGQAEFDGKIEFATSYWIFDGQTGGGPGNWKTNFGFKVHEIGDANAVIRIGYSGGLVTADYIYIYHVEIHGEDQRSSSGGSYSNDGLAIYGRSNITLSYYWMHGIGRCPFYTCVSNLIAEYGFVSPFMVPNETTVHGELMSTLRAWAVMGTVTMRYSIFNHAHSTGGFMWDNSGDHSAEFRYYGNVYYKAPTDTDWQASNGLIGGWTGGGLPPEDCYGLRIYGNTFWGLDILIFTPSVDRQGDNYAYNNLFYNCTSPTYGLFTGHDYNHYINSGGAHSEANGTSAVSGDPCINAISYDFNISAPTVAGKTDLGSPYDIDPDGVTRGADGLWDRGAYEYVLEGDPEESAIKFARIG